MLKTIGLGKATLGFMKGQGLNLGQCALLVNSANFPSGQDFDSWTAFTCRTSAFVVPTDW